MTDLQVQQCLGRYPHNGHVFTEVSEKLRAHGYFRSAEQCHTRIKRLKSNYRQCKENMRQTGIHTQRHQLAVYTSFTPCFSPHTLSSSGTDQVDFKFYDLLEQILEKQPSTSSTVITDSIEISEESNGESVTERGKLYFA